MSVELRSSKKEIFLIGDVKHQITGSKLPSNGQVLAVLFYNIREVNLSVNESANLTIRECIIYWEKARIPTRSIPNCVKKLVNLYQVWRELQKNAKKTQEVFEQRRQEFVSNLNNLFDIAHADALQLIKINEDKIFLQRQREPGRPGHLAGVDKKVTNKEERTRLRIIEEEKRRAKYFSSLAPSTSSCEPPLEKSSSDSEIIELEENRPSAREASSQPDKTSMRKNIITPKLVAALDRCQLSVRDSVFIIVATIEALGHNTNEFPISKSSIHRVRTEMRKERAEAIKIGKEELCGPLFEKNIDDFVSVKSKFLFNRLQIDDSFLNKCPSSWSNDDSFLQAKRKLLGLKAVNDTAERAVKLMQDFHGLITVQEEQKQFLLRCVQEHRQVYPDCKKQTLKRKFDD